MQAQNINLRNPVYNNYERVTPERLLNEGVFYKLLITQLKNQDPLSPMKVEDFTAQLTQLTQLEEVRKINDYMKLMSANLIGKKVTTGDDNKTSREVTGIEMDSKSHKVMVELEDGSKVDLKDVTNITETKKEKEV